MSAAKLYSPQLLAAAVELARWPALDAPQHSGEARSATCGSTIRIDCDCDAAGRIVAIGMRVRACAVGQAAAAVFARHACGKNAAEIAQALDELTGWITQEGAQPQWPDCDLIAPARDFPGRHGAMLLPWRAAQEALGHRMDDGKALSSLSSAR